MKQIDALPDDILLEIFDFYVTIVSPSHWGKRAIEAWQLLVHVCRRWRNLVFGSPRRLNLRLYCTPETPAKDILDLWPALPLIVRGDKSMALLSGTVRTDNVIAALGQSNRVCKVSLLELTNWQLEKVLAAMQAPFPELTDLELCSHYKTLQVIPLPDSFLGGSAPSLRNFELSGIPFPGLPNLLLSSTHLVRLSISNIPHSGYISPEAIVALISVLSSLDTLHLIFQSPQSRPDWQSRRLPAPQRSILPALTKFSFKGVTEYLEEVVIRINTPQLDKMGITFFNQIDFNCPQLTQFINCTPTLTGRASGDWVEAHVQFTDSAASVKLRYRTSHSTLDRLEIVILCREPDRQLSSIEQVCNGSFLHPLSTVVGVNIERRCWLRDMENDGIENTLWLQFLLPFTSAKGLLLSKEIAPGIAAALEELDGSRITEVLPSLQNIYVAEPELSGPFKEKIGRFVSMRQHSGHPIGISTFDISKALESI